MMKVSACVICKNEEANIGHWLESVRPLADELIVVDTGSSDRTMELARAGGAMVCEFPWIDDFSAAKNYALDQASGDWIIFLDTDEYFRPEDISHIRPFLKQIHYNRKIAGLVSPLVNIDVDQHDRVLTTGYQMRIFRREGTLRYRGCVHEMVMNLAPEGQDREFRMTEFTIMHTGYSAKIMKAKSRRNLKLLLADANSKGGFKANHFTYLVDSYMQLEEYDKALHFAELAVKHDKECTLAGLSKKVYWQLLSLMKVMNWETAKIDQRLDQFQAEHPDWPELYWWRALLRYEEQDYVQAEQLFLMTRELSQQDDKRPEAMVGTMMPGVQPQFHYYYGDILAHRSNFESARREWEEALTLYPFYEDAFQKWYQLQLYQEKSANERLEQLRRFYDFNRDRLFLLKQLHQFALDEAYQEIRGSEQDGFYGALWGKDYMAAAQLAGSQLKSIHHAVIQAAEAGKPDDLAAWRSMVPQPLVSIMIPTYNRPLYFEQALKSVLAQTYQNLDIIICDNSTNETTAELMQPYLGDSRIRYIRNREAKSKAENFAPFESLVRGEYLQWLMDDDMLAPEKIARMVAVFECEPGISMVTSRRGIIDEQGTLIGQNAQELKIDGSYMIAQGKEAGRIMLAQMLNYLGEPSAVLFRHSDLRHHYWQAESRGCRAISDVAMWLELLEQGDCVIFKDPLSYYRRHAGQEGQQADVVLLSRMEWLRLGEEYYKRQVFLTEASDLLSLIGHILAEQSIMVQDVRPLASSGMWQRYEAALARAQQYQQELLSQKH